MSVFMSVIEINQLTFSYNKYKHQSNPIVLDHLNLQIESGENVGLIGCNGAGKSTLLKLLVGIELPPQGDISVMGQRVDKKHLQQIRSQVGYVFQDSDSQLFMSTVYEDVAFGPENYGLSAEDVKHRTMDALKQVHMEQHRDKRGYQLSGGEKKLASIATVLSMQPKVILLDEPSVALDPQNRRNLIQVLNEIQTTKLVASHDLDFILDTCNRTILMSEGRIIADGTTTEILHNEDLLEANGLELPLSLYRR